MNKHNERAELIALLKEAHDLSLDEEHFAARQRIMRAAAMLEAQPAREWAGLTVDEFYKIWNESDTIYAAMNAVDALLIEKNAGQPAADEKAVGEPVNGVVLQKSLGQWRPALVDDAEWHVSHRGAKRLYTHPHPQAEVRVPDGYVLVKLCFGKVDVASGNHEGVPALIFGKSGTGIIGEATQPDRMHAEGETLACVTFANAESLEVVQHHINEVRAMLAAAPKPQ